MSTLSRPLVAPRLGSALQTLAAEAAALLRAFAKPGELIAEVEQMRSLYKQADRIEAANPARAALLRRRAARIGL